MGMAFCSDSVTISLHIFFSDTGLGAVEVLREAQVYEIGMFS